MGDTMLLSATTAGRQPKEQFDFFPLTVDVEERMYAAGRIPGSFFRREGRPSEDAILTCRLIDRPLRPTFAKGLRNEVQVVITVMALDPDAPVRRGGDQRRLGVHPALRPAVLRPGRRHPRRAHRRPVGRLPDARGARRTPSSTWSWPAGVLPDGDVAIMMVEAEATEKTIELIAGGATAPTEEVVAQGLEAAKPAIRELCEAQSELAEMAAKPVAEFPRFLDYQDDVYAAVEAAAAEELAQRPAIAGKHEREDAHRRAQGPRQGRSSPASSRAARRRSPAPSAR